MSSVYHTEPSTKGKVILHTSYGAIDVELWPKEAPLACRNFVQLSLEGYYDQTLFHRVIPGFMVQGGDPSGSGEKGDSIWEKPFKDEIHPKLRFNHRGQLAMANENKPNTNRSQFFFTLDECRWLDGKHTIFGTVAGNTIFNLLRMGTVETDNDRPVDDIMLKSVEVLNNPFHDIVPRLQTMPPPINSKPRPPIITKKKDTKLLSFIDDEPEDEEQVVAATIKMPMKPNTLPLPFPEEKKKTVKDLNQEALDFAARMSQKLHTKQIKRPRPIHDEPSRVRNNDIKPPLETKARKAVASTHLTAADQANEDASIANALLSPYEALRRKRSKQDLRHREQDTLSRLATFQNALKSRKQASSDHPSSRPHTSRASYHGQLLDDDQDDDGNAPDWFAGKLKFKKHTDELFRTAAEDGHFPDDYVTLDDKEKRIRSTSGYT